MKLTKRTVDLATTGETVSVVWDEELRGFGLRVYPKRRDVPDGDELPNRRKV